MPVLHYQGGEMPEPAEFRRLLHEANEKYDPVDELLTLERALYELEQRHGVSSAEFFARYEVGAAGDDPELVGWAARYDAFLRLKTAISESLKLIVAAPVVVLP